LKAQCPDCGEVFEFPEEDKVDVLLFGNWRKYHFCKRELLILDSLRVGYKFAIHLRLRDSYELDKVRKALESLGITLRFPER